MSPNNQSLDNTEELLDQAIADFLRAESEGHAGDRQCWIDRYPNCESGLREFFDNREQVLRLVTPDSGVDSNLSDSIKLTDFYSPAPDDSKRDTTDYIIEPPHLSNTRYRPLRFHARGGMGEIWLANDEHIGRQVAIKKLRAGREPQQARFLVEAQVTGQLEHPSIVPLHDLGFDDEGQPFYVMKLIKGRPLTSAITEFHAHKRSSDWTSDRQFRRLLELFIDVCNAIAYAHSKGVLHRDIKPDNVMLGHFGETAVLDWGLAKVIGKCDEPQDIPVRLSGSASSSATQDGAVVGSPFYMSPEGAQWGVEAIDHSSDIYLLGATLYEILTANPPRRGSSQQELLELARRGRPTPPRQIERQIPRALEAICLKAMAFEKCNRYDSPLALADDMERFLADEPTAAYREPFLTRVRRWLWRHRRGIVRTAALFLIILVSSIAVQQFQRSQWFAKREEARGQLQEFNRLADEAQFFAANTDAALERVPYFDASRAQAMGAAAIALTSPWGTKAENLPLVEDRESFLKTKSSLLLQMARVNIDQTQPPERDLRQALAFLSQVSEIQTPSHGYLRLKNRCLALLQDTAATAADSTWDTDKPITAEDYFLEGDRLRTTGASVRANSIEDEQTSARKDLEAAIEYYRKALQIDPRHFWARFQLGRCLMAQRKHSQAVEALSACVAMRPNSVWAYSVRGLAYEFADQTAPAMADFDTALRLAPDFQPARLNRGIAHWLEYCKTRGQESYDAALVDFSAVLTVPADKRLVEAAFYRGQLLLQKSRARDAIPDLSLVIESQPKLRAAYWFRAQACFQVDDYEGGRNDLAKYVSLGADNKTENLAHSHLVSGRTWRLLAQHLTAPGQTEALKQAVSELKASQAAGLSSTELFAQLGAVYELQGKVPEAIEAYSDGLNLASNSAVLHNLRGWALVKTKRDLAKSDFAESVRVDPHNAESHTGLGYIEALNGNGDAARREAAIALLSDADNYLTMHNIACIYAQLSVAEPEQKVECEDLAIQALGRAVTLCQLNAAVSPELEIDLIRSESSFPDSLRTRPQFQQLLSASGSRQ